MYIGTCPTFPRSRNNAVLPHLQRVSPTKLNSQFLFLPPSIQTTLPPNTIITTNYPGIVRKGTRLSPTHANPTNTNPRCCVSPPSHASLASAPNGAVEASQSRALSPLQNYSTSPPPQFSDSDFPKGMSSRPSRPRLGNKKSQHVASFEPVSGITPSFLPRKDYCWNCPVPKGPVSRARIGFGT